MTQSHLRIPPGPSEKFGAADDLLSWMDSNLARYGNIYKASIYGSNVYVVSSPDYAEHILLKNWKNYHRKGHAVKRIALTLGNGLISSNGEFWVSQRRMIQPAFNRDAVDLRAHAITKPSVALRDKWKLAARNGTSVNVSHDVSATVLEITLSAIFGEDYESIAPHFSIVAEESRNLEFARTLSALGKVVIRTVAQRRDKGISSSDILGMMMQSRDRDSGRPMPDAQLAREILTLIVAGHETTSSVLSWVWYLLARNPAVEANLAAELQTLDPEIVPALDTLHKYPYSQQIIEEAMRLYPPLWLMTRKAIEDDHLGDYFVPAGTEIYISPYLIQRDPALWEEPGRFDPARFKSGDLAARHRLATCPFGAGPRNCVGEYFARVEMQIQLMVVAKQLRLQYDAMAPAEFVANVNLVSRSDFEMTPKLKNTTG